MERYGTALGVVSSKLIRRNLSLCDENADRIGVCSNGSKDCESDKSVESRCSQLQDQKTGSKSR